MSKKILIVGGVAGGASAAARIRRLDESANIIVFEKGPHVSFSNCCLPYHLSGQIENHEELVLMTPDKFFNQYNINTRIYNEVLSIDRENKSIKVKNVVTGKTYEEGYDKLILSPGANAIVPPIEGIEDAKTFVVKNVVDIAKLNQFITSKNATNVSVVGAGFIGMEVAENLKEAGYNVTLIEAANQVMRTFDEDMVQILHKELFDQGINLILGDKVTKFNNSDIVLESGKIVQSDAVVMAIGVKPEVTLAKECGLEIGETGALKVDSNYRTIDKDIYAVGDAIEVTNAISRKIQHLPLAGPAQKQARAVADHIYGLPVKNTGYIGSSCIKVFDYNAACTGLTEAQCKNLGINYDSVYVIPQDKVGLMPDNNHLHFKLIFEVPTGKVLGAQSIGKGNVDKRVDIVATLIKMGGDIDDLRDLELCYAPPFGTAKDAVNHAALVALNIMNNTFKQVHVSDVRKLVEENAYIIDAREKNEYEEGHIINAVNIPLSEIRNRIDEIPTDKPVYIHCRSAQRSYNASVLLGHLGFENIYNISGSFLGICFYEYFRDKSENRKPIVTNYNFK
ncbi:FAD-dependent oxidoreductase [Romboutsia lituseburensis]|uniref:NADPH-dependent 2,4-dienoyl-CoA reductase, sulfur reductase n=1 Tax=Romboutsia lituseburensis DSM 797 TaxID=1121325 RepID=A0A1G9IWK5_9FIRM|nr:FAD-dependent oxidoreductase [Romboutsia lituseburensis]CEH33731.1 Coenzyme A disulfide reductase [Romboutsia lituseburensis]SDL29456.1 NADPH-dependent 2,4-dienoyl-CoA reductase, sulfur reductase [Romboutsia lituseburensis DSM 797]